MFLTKPLPLCYPACIFFPITRNKYQLFGTRQQNIGRLPPSHFPSLVRLFVRSQPLAFESPVPVWKRRTGESEAIQNHPASSPGQFRYPSDRIRFGTEHDSKKAWHKIAKKVLVQREKVPDIARKKLHFSARIREYFGCIS